MVGGGGADLPRLTNLRLVALSVYWLAVAYMLNSVSALVLPYLVRHFVGRAQKNSYLALLEAVGALVAMFYQPLMGTLSDYWPSRFGRRHPFVVVGSVGDVVALGLMALAPGYWLLLVTYQLLQVASNTAQGPYQALMPDAVPRSQRGLASGLYGMANLVGTIAGFLIVGTIFLRHGLVTHALVSVAVLLLVTMIITVRFVPDRPHPDVVRPRARELVRRTFKVEFRRYRDFMWLLGSRLFILMGVTSLGSFAFNYVDDVFHLRPATWGAVLLSVVVGMAALVTLPAGWVSTRIGRRPLVIAAGGVGAVGAALLSAAPSIGVALVFGSIIGIGFGMFLSVDWAFATDLVPKAEAGKYLGFSNIATAGAGVFARLLGGPLIDITNHLAHSRSTGYRVLLVVTAGYFLVGMLLVLKVREHEES